NCEGHECPTPYLNSKSILQSSPSRKVITLSKQIEKDSHTHAKHVRITINSEGKVTKLAVSR
ncbi:MAG: hypothetical protein P8Y72_05965, partial [Anaerolineales bacterium]